ncbi:unnamed protein product [Lactuca virosa]|uniref:Amino acid transporter transmembrane domain-containing protein n=1 Tax=Lactuca virosa TaxID=75947 RepID=A0AAU9LLM5_9ASTR|nr:unnamed protein product [Lactuca virosa]
MESGADARNDRRTAEEKAIDDWLPVTSSRNAKWWYSAFHNATAMVGAGVLSLPYALSQLGWGFGITVLVLSWVITLYTLWQMVEMHEMVPGKRFDRYHELGQHAFGEKLGFYVVEPLVLPESSIVFREITTANSGAHIANGGPVSDFDERWITFTAMEVVSSEVPKNVSVSPTSLQPPVPGQLPHQVAWRCGVPACKFRRHICGAPSLPDTVVHHKAMASKGSQILQYLHDDNLYDNNILLYIVVILLALTILLYTCCSIPSNLSSAPNATNSSSLSQNPSSAQTQGLNVATINSLPITIYHQNLTLPYLQNFSPSGLPVLNHSTGPPMLPGSGPGPASSAPGSSNSVHGTNLPSASSPLNPAARREDTGSLEPSRYRPTITRWWRNKHHKVAALKEFLHTQSTTSSHHVQFPHSNRHACSTLIPIISKDPPTQPSILSGKRPATSLNVSIPTKSVRTASRQRIISPFHAGTFGSVQAPHTIDASSGDTNSFQDEQSSLHGGSQIPNNMEVEDPHLTTDGNLILIFKVTRRITQEGDWMHISLIRMDRRGEANTQIC